MQSVGCGVGRPGGFLTRWAGMPLVRWHQETCSHHATVGSGQPWQHANRPHHQCGDGGADYRGHDANVVSLLLHSCCHGSTETVLSFIRQQLAARTRRVVDVPCQQGVQRKGRRGGAAGVTGARGAPQQCRLQRFAVPAPCGWRHRAAKTTQQHIESPRTWHSRQQAAQPSPLAPPRTRGWLSG